MKQLSQKVHSGLKSINDIDNDMETEMYYTHIGINQELQTEEAGPDRNTANHRIKKAQVSDT